MMKHLFRRPEVADFLLGLCQEIFLNHGMVRESLKFADSSAVWTGLIDAEKPAWPKFLALKTPFSGHRSRRFGASCHHFEHADLGRRNRSVNDRLAFRVKSRQHVFDTI